jgi:predicted nucleic acid-binding protein
VYPETYAHAARLYRRCRAAGRTVRATVDCLIAALALEHDLPVLTLDRDFETLRSIAGVRVVPR